MKKLLVEIKEHVRNDFEIRSYAFVLGLVSLMIFLNYTFHFNRILNGFYTKPSGLLIFPAFYLGVYFLGAVPVLMFKKRKDVLRSREFWVKTIVFVGIAGLMAGFSYHSVMVRSFVSDAFSQHFIIRVGSNLKRIVPYLLVLYLMKRIYDKKDKHLYGLRFGGMDYRPFLLILLIPAIMAAIASFSADFQKTYPLFKYWRAAPAFELPPKVMFVIYEIAYIVDFIAVEIMFRGALVIGLARIMGKEAVLPMAVLYVFIHFGKPAGETISSFFGGYILGVIALNRRNIGAGILLHVALALMMDTAAILQHELTKTM